MVSKTPTYYINNFKLKSRIILEELDSAHEQIEPQLFFHIVSLFPMHVQRRENVTKGEQARVKPMELQELVNGKNKYRWNLHRYKLKYKIMNRIHLKKHNHH